MDQSEQMLYRNEWFDWQLEHDAQWLRPERLCYSCEHTNMK